MEDFYHALTWPQLSYVAEDEKGNIVGYILGKMFVLAGTMCSSADEAGTKSLRTAFPTAM